MTKQPGLKLKNLLKQLLGSLLLDFELPIKGKHHPSTLIARKGGGLSADYLSLMSMGPSIKGK